MKSFIYFFSLIITTNCLAQTQILATKSGVDTNGRGSYTYQFLNSQNEKCIYDYYDGVLIWNDIGSKEYFCYAKRGENLELRMLNNFQNKYLIDTPNELKVTEVKKNSDSANIDEKNKEIKLSNLLTQIGNLNDVNGKRTEYYDKSKTTVILNQNEMINSNSNINHLNHDLMTKQTLEIETHLAGRKHLKKLNCLNITWLVLMK